MMTFFGTGFASFDGLPATARCVWGEAAVETHARTMTTPVVLEDSHVVCSSAPVSGFSGAYYFVSAKLALNGIEYGVPVSAPPPPPTPSSSAARICQLVLTHIIVQRPASCSIHP